MFLLIIILFKCTPFYFFPGQRIISFSLKSGYKSKVINI